MDTADKVQKSNRKDVASWIMGSGFAYAGAHSTELSKTKINPDNLSRLIKLVIEGKASLQIAKEKIFPDMVEKGDAPEKILQNKGLEQVSDDKQLQIWVFEVIEANPKVVGDFRSGKETAAMFLVGQVMKKSRGAANPIKVKEMMMQKLKA